MPQKVQVTSFKDWQPIGGGGGRSDRKRKSQEPQKIKYLQKKGVHNKRPTPPHLEAKCLLQKYSPKKSQKKKEHQKDGGPGPEPPPKRAAIPEQIIPCEGSELDQHYWDFQESSCPARNRSQTWWGEGSGNPRGGETRAESEDGTKSR